MQFLARRSSSRPVAVLLAAALYALASCGSSSGSSTKLSSIQVTPAASSIAIGTTRVYKATAIYSDSTKQDLTAEVTWSASDELVGTISNAAGSLGVATGVGVGRTTITATHSGVSGSTTLDVTNAALIAIEVTPVEPALALGTAVQLTATGVFSDDTAQDLTDQVAWASSAEAVASVSNDAGSRGLATAAAVGMSTVSATLDGVSGSTALQVTPAALASIEVTPTSPAIALGTALQLAATGVFSDATVQDLTSQVAWSSSEPSVASFSGASGQVDSHAAGTATLTATLSGKSGTTELSVVPASLVSIEIWPVDPSVALGTWQQFQLTARYTDDSTQDVTELATWTSSDGSVAAISSAAGSSGLAVAVGVGTATLSAALAGEQAATQLTVTDAVLVAIDLAPTNPSIALGTVQPLSAIGTYSDSSTQVLTELVTWSSSDALVAAVSNAAGNKGLAASLGEGTCTISAMLAGMSGATSLTVTDALLVDLDLAPADPTVAVGAPQQFAATGTYTDSSTQDLTGLATWSSSDPDVAAVSNAEGSRGLAQSLGLGSTTIAAELSGIQGSTLLAVTHAALVEIRVAPVDGVLPSGYSRRYSALGSYSDGSDVDVSTLVTWSSSSASVATVSNAAGSKGQVSGGAPGAATISATLDGVAGSAALLVTAETLGSIAVEPDSATLAVGETLQLAAIGHFSGGTALDITTQVQWFSGNKSVASAGNGDYKGLVTAKRAGSATIRAKKGNKSGTAQVTVP